MLYSTRIHYLSLFNILYINYHSKLNKLKSKIKIYKQNYCYNLQNYLENTEKDISLIYTYSSIILENKSLIIYTLFSPRTK